MRRGEIEHARTLLEEVDARAVARGHEYTHMNVLWYLATLEWLAGRWQRALEHAIAAHEVTEQIHEHTGFTGRFKALVETDLGLVEEARASIDEGLAHSQAFSSEPFVVATLGVLGRLEFLLGNLPAAGDHLRELPGRLLAGGLNEHSQLTSPVWREIWRGPITASTGVPDLASYSLSSGRG